MNQKFLFACDYVLDNQDKFWIVSNYGDKPLGKIVYEPHPQGTRYNPLTNKFYNKVVNDYPFVYPIPPFNKIKKIFKPLENFANNYKNLPIFWKTIPDILISIGVNKNDIGIFGSTLIGFEQKKDIDFLVYGKENCWLIYRQIDLITKKLQSHPLSLFHAHEQFLRNSNFFLNQLTFLKTTSNKWMTLGFDNEVYSTLRFIYRKEEIPKDIKIKSGQECTISGTVFNAYESSFIPRVFYVKTKNDEIFRVLSYGWMLQSAVRDGQKIVVKGNLNLKNKTVYLSAKEHWISL